MMARRPSGQRRRMRVLLLAVVGGIMFGIVGMHGLAVIHSHGTVVASTAMVSHGLDVPAAVVSAAVMNGAGHQGHEAPGHGDDCGLVTCCLTALFSGALLLWAALMLRRQRVVAWIRRASTVLQTQVTSVARPRPDLISLSILRC